MPQPPLNIEDELKDSYLNYAMSVLISRALPDVRDGLKPSQRRILLAMHDLNLGPTASTTKCAGIIGETMKRYHPHGDQSIYMTLVRLAQDWSMRHCLVHPQGNFGSIAGLPPAAHRYTEARLTHIGAEMLADLERDTVDFIDNYDGKYREPLVLPSKFPNLLVNGADGIAVGMATEIPPHNLREVCDAAIRVIDEPDVTIEELMEIIPGPDFPTGGIICGRQGIVRRLLHRPRQDQPARPRRHQRGRSHQIIIKEVPYQMTRNRLTEAMGELVKDERIKGIREIRDTSSQRQGVPVQIIIYLKRDADAQLVLNQLYQYSPLQQHGQPDHAGAGGRPAADAQPQANARGVRAPPRAGDPPPCRIPAARGEAARPRARRPADRHLVDGRSRQHLPRCRRAGRRPNYGCKGWTLPPPSWSAALGAEHFAAPAREFGTHAIYHMTEAQAEAIVPHAARPARRPRA